MLSQLAESMMHYANQKYEQSPVSGSQKVFSFFNLFYFILSLTMEAQIYKMQNIYELMLPSAKRIK